jgi:CheY-like chemotaxis protein
LLSKSNHSFKEKEYSNLAKEHRNASLAVTKNTAQSRLALLMP